MEQVLQLARQYQTEFHDDYTLLRIQARLIHTEIENQIKRYRHKIEALQSRKHGKQSQLVETITNAAPVNYDAENIMRTFTWAAVLLLTASFCSLLSSYFFSFFVGLVLSPFAAGVCAYAILPLIVHQYISKTTAGKYAWNEMILRHALLAFAIVEGLLIGYVMSDRVLASTPPLAALTPAMIGVMTPLLQPMIKDNRAALLVATIAGSFALHIVIGIMLGLSTAYILLATIYTAIGLVALQLFIDNVNENTVFTHIYQFSILYLTLLSQFIIYQLFGGKPEDMRN